MRGPGTTELNFHTILQPSVKALMHALVPYRLVHRREIEYDLCTVERQVVWREKRRMSHRGDSIALCFFEDV